MPSTGPFDLSKTPIHLGSVERADSPAIPLEGFNFDGPSWERYLAEHCADGGPGRIVMIETTPTDWPAWERHTQGDELVIVLEGKAVFIQEVDGEERRMDVGPGSTVINPVGVWHTADVSEPMKAIYVTPAPGTESRQR